MEDKDLAQSITSTYGRGIWGGAVGVIASYFIILPIKILLSSWGFNLPWLLNQHSMDNIIPCFDSTTGEPRAIPNKPNGEIMTQWPGFYEHNFGRRLTRFGLFPAPIFNKGFLDAVSSNKAENTLERLSRP